MTKRARPSAIWMMAPSAASIRGSIAERGALDVAREEHARICEAIGAGDPDLARAATLLHIVRNETWLREHLGPADDVPLVGGR